MKQVFRRPFPAWPKLVLGGLLLAFALTAAFHALGRPMPTPELACALKERELMWGRAETVYRGTITYRAPSADGFDGVPEGSPWLVRRDGDNWAVAIPRRVGVLPLWSFDYAVYRWASLRERELITLDPYAGREFFAEDGSRWSEYVILAVTGDAPVARLEGSCAWVPDILADDRAAALERDGAAIGFVQAAPGVWEGRVTVPHWRGEGGSSLESAYRAYDAGGGLLYDSEDR